MTITSEGPDTLPQDDPDLEPMPAPSEPTAAPDLDRAEPATGARNGSRDTTGRPLSSVATGYRRALHRICRRTATSTWW